MIDKPIQTILLSIAIQVFALFSVIGLYFAG